MNPSIYNLSILEHDHIKTESSSLSHESVYSKAFLMEETFWVEAENPFDSRFENALVSRFLEKLEPPFVMAAEAEGLVSEGSDS